MPPTVAIHAQLLRGRAGGIETNLLGLLAALAKLEDCGEQVVIGPGGESEWLRPHLGPRQSLLAWPPIRFTPPPDGGNAVARVRRLAQRVRDRWRRGTLTHVRVWPPRVSGTWRSEGERVTRVLVERGVAVVHFPYQRHFPTSLPTIFEPWDLQHRHHPEFFTDEEIRLREHIYRSGCAAAAIVVAASEWTKADLVKEYGLEPSKIVVIRRGVMAPPPPSRQQAEIVRRALGLPERFALYPAKTWPHKNHGRLFEALALLRDRGGPRVPLVCTGSPQVDQEERIRAAVSRWRLEDTVIFTGRVNEVTLASLYVSAHILVFPSLFEGLGIPLLEAMHYGLPIACSTVTCLPETAGRAAVYFDATSVEAIAAAVSRLWQDEDLRATCRAEGTARLAAFDWGAAARQFAAFYRLLAGWPRDTALAT